VDLLTQGRVNMTEVSFTRDVGCGRDRIRELLSNHDFLTAFVTLQHPVRDEVSIDIDESSSTLAWAVSTEKIPAVFRRFVGDTLPVRLVITPQGLTPDEDGTVHLDLEGKVSGELRASLGLRSDDQDPKRTAVAVRGPFNIHAGLLSGKASEMASQHMVLPILEELADLLEEWCGTTKSLEGVHDEF
jgi:Protein of unknown function (DUF2505)